MSTVYDLITSAPEETDALRAPGRPPLSNAALRTLITDTMTTLNGLGIGRNDRVAIVLPNGPEMAASFIAVAACATAAPLNPAYKRDEFEFYLSDLKAKALIVPKGSVSPALEAAHAAGVAVIFLNFEETNPAGAFTIEAAEQTGAAVTPQTGFAKPDDVALVLHTSGTTSRPKIVPLSQRNICASAGNIQKTLRLETSDVCMNVMPLFHIHGLMACTLAPLSAGCPVFATPGFDALKFFSWLSESRPTWYSAVPTMHQAILTRAKRNQGAIESAQLRFIRSSSASLPPSVLADLESTFSAPVVEAYAMTEAAHQMTCNPLPPEVRKPGTVGQAAGPEVAIMDEETAELLTPGKAGEVVIRGENVTKGYESNEAANAVSFVEGWFRTGDQGVMDNDGYLTITGRLKEIINRGGEKISPREVDEILLDHSDIAQAVTFAIPHKMLGEEVGAAVVLKSGGTAGADEIRAFATEKLAAFKVPRKIVVLDEIPKGPTGKLQRIGLAEKLGLTS
ncbi:acyl--CoA ligase [Hyphococcus sp.]|uniref:acyl--CoA ligase n=1 Tax=Hyphococcus sp. TaxID=2038636 RepID=UPI003CCBF6CB